MTYTHSITFPTHRRRLKTAAANRFAGMLPASLHPVCLTHWHSCWYSNLKRPTSRVDSLEAHPQHGYCWHLHPSTRFCVYVQIYTCIHHTSPIPNCTKFEGEPCPSASATTYSNWNFADAKSERHRLKYVLSGYHFLFQALCVRVWREQIGGSKSCRSCDLQLRYLFRDCATCVYSKPHGCWSLQDGCSGERWGNVEGIHLYSAYR